ncbi:ABC transporter permease [Zhihengliuella halotolerans]|uniref:Putative ABC transport system permease protein n=1 Tax=Zhihengliuella halotolerans TaxID=370736 RepID=A0A4Q8AAK5_9MICC|nr:ABC transporter permease [Zhihengliuella halotolerans]RZU60691.1 putative ABC transport system permease protein [Zhihengliuella halotolerans]
MNRIGRLFTGFIAAIVEAWQELRIHRLRVLLSLIGVTVAVASLTTALAGAGIAQQVVKENFESEGRPALIVVNAYDPSAIGPGGVSEGTRSAFETTAERFDVTYSSMVGSAWGIRAGREDVSVTPELSVVDPEYAPMHRLVTQQGRWLEAEDSRNMSPAVVVDETLLKELGLEGAQLPLTIDLESASTVTATVVGSVPRHGYGEAGSLWMLPDTYQRWFGVEAPLEGAEFRLWVPIEGSEELAMSFARAMQAEVPGLQVDAFRQDYMAWGQEESLNQMALAVSAIAAIILLLGSLSLLNVAMVTMKQRVREVGIRRSFGATTGRVFFSVMMESVVATALAGLVGVMLSIAIISSPWVAEALPLGGIDEMPGFPLEAALLGLGISVAVGALTGVLPALVAARVRIVDAIRF